MPRASTSVSFLHTRSHRIAQSLFDPVLAMHFKSVALMALASVAIASPNEDYARRQASVNPTEVSVLAVLATALPPSLVAIGVTNPAEVGSIVASSFSAGNTPAWYSGLPSDVKNYLTVLYAAVTPSSTPSSTPAPSSSASVVTIVSTSVAIVSNTANTATISPSGNSTVISTVHSATLSPTTLKTGAAASTGTQAASSTSTGGASLPTAVMGAGIAGAIGFLGMLAL